MATKITLIIPSINPETWVSSYEQMFKSCTKYPFEVIGIGPFLPPEALGSVSNFKFIKDFGCPSRCLQIASLLAEGDYISWCPDDAKILEGAYDEAIKYFDENLTENDGMCSRYSEGENFADTQSQDEAYWIARTHPDLQLPGVKEGWRGAAVFIYRRDTWYKFGGLDCRFEHINLNAHDLAFAIQAKGGRIVLSPPKILAVNWNPNPMRPVYLPILTSYHQNDLPLLKHIYASPTAAEDRNIKLDNWRRQPALWPRRFKVQ